jgi:thiosulfate reductase cytochrome b subunit
MPFSDSAGAPVSASRTYEIFNQNGWGRSRHFLAAWVLVATGAIYLLAGMVTRHFWRHLVPGAAELTPRRLGQELRDHLWLHIRPATSGPQYGLLQKCSYIAVVFLALPLMALTGLAMSPAVTAGYPVLLDFLRVRRACAFPDRPRAAGRDVRIHTPHARHDGRRMTFRTACD